MPTKKRSITRKSMTKRRNIKGGWIVKPKKAKGYKNTKKNR